MSVRSFDGPVRTLCARWMRGRFAEPYVQRLRELDLSGVFWLTAMVLLGSLLLGGGTRSGFLSDAVLQLLSIPPLLVSFSRLADIAGRDRTARRQVRFVLGFCSAIVAVPLLQLMPLPHRLWMLLPNRGPELAVFAALGRSPDWMPVSVSASATSLSALSLLPPFAVFLGTTLLTRSERRLLSLSIVCFGFVSSFLGLLQLSQGPSSPMRFFAVTNLTEAVGFFANRNHFAALLYATLIFAGAWAVDIGFNSRFSSDRKAFEAGSIGALTASLLSIVVLLAAVAMARSRAGMVLTMLSLLGICALFVADPRRKFRSTPVALVLAATGLAAMLVLQFGLYRILQAFTIDPFRDSRFQFLRITIRAAKDYLPFGSGMGTFVPVYAIYERPANAFAQYVNHAHNDIAELALESGAIGMGLLLVFALWFLSRSTNVWLRVRAGADAFDLLLARAATIAIALLIAHSFVDYPMRTAAMMAVFAFACGLLMEPLTAEARKPERVSRTSRRAMAAPKLAPAQAMSEVATMRGPVPDKPVAGKPPRGSLVRWGEGIDWPEAWRKSRARQEPKTDEPQPPLDAGPK